MGRMWKSYSEDNYGSHYHSWGVVEIGQGVQFGEDFVHHFADAHMSFVVWRLVANYIRKTTSGLWTLFLEFLLF